MGLTAGHGGAPEVVAEHLDPGSGFPDHVRVGDHGCNVIVDKVPVKTVPVDADCTEHGDEEDEDMFNELFGTRAAVAAAAADVFMLVVIVVICDQG